MPCSRSRQVKILLRKNLHIMSKNYEVTKSLIIPLLSFFILYLSKPHQNQVLQILSIFFVSISLAVVTRQVVLSMVEEKQSKQKEIQKIMGVHQSSYVIGWLLTNLFRTAVVIIFFLVLCIPTGVFDVAQNSTIVPNETQLIFGYILFGLATMANNYFVSVFFVDPKNAAAFAMILTFLGDFFVQLFSIPYVLDHSWVIYIMALIPSTCFSRLIIGPLIPNDHISFSFDAVLYMLVFDMVLYFTLYFYFDQVLPNEYGVQKSPLFFLKSNKNKNKDGPNNGLTQSLIDRYKSEGTVKDTSSAVFHQEMPQDQNLICSVQISNLSKSFGDVKAVDGLSLQLYESQILCLLGHNGSGKTTTISLVTGLIEKNQGDVKFYGQSIDSNLDDIRQMTGICVQKDVLYDDLTVEQHLRYYAEMKGFSGHELENEIQYILSRCVLQTDKSKLPKQLSGGNKRKLSLGMALIGKSKIVFLDEPTSGMDPATRRVIWDILTEMKQEQRTIILTTHYLDEAEFLSERIAILAHGKLLTVGSADFIKKNFGIGYHLNIFKKMGYQDSTKFNEWENKKQSIKSLVKSQIYGSQYNPQTAEDTLTFLLPFQNKLNLLPILKKLESDTSLQIDLAMTSLEEAFVNIGMDLDKFMIKVGKESLILPQSKDNSTIVNHNYSDDDDKDQNTDFSSISIPSCLYNQPTYSYISQFKACFLRKYYTIQQGRRLVLQILVPLYFEVIGVVTCYFNNQGPSDSHQKKSLLSFASITLTLNLSFSLCMAAAGMAGQPVLERENKLKYALTVMGCRISPYWMATLAFDCLVSSIPVTLLIVLLLTFGMPSLATPQLCAVYFSVHFAFIGLSYAVSWLYSSTSTVLKTAFFVMLTMFLIVPSILMRWVQHNFMYWICAVISPLMAMFQAISVDSFYSGSPDSTGKIAINSHYPYIALMILQGLAGLFLSIYIDTRSLRSFNAQNVQVQQVNEQDVLAEAQRVESSSCLDHVKIQNLSKTYSNGFQAVKGTSFGIDQGQVFGLLGPNGAGKSTTFNMITSRLKPTSGKVLLLNQETSKGNSELYQNVGICPQFDCMWDFMTPIENLTIFAMIKGFTGQNIHDSVEYFIKILQLDEYRNTMAGNLSGGNKRKLSVAIAMIGSPCLQFFDEPSSGLDPIARRFLWNTIQQSLRINSSAMVLTTHSMDEAESLCNKIGIQVNGQFVCMGSPQQLKTKYGSGYRITLDVKDQSVPLAKMVSEKFPTSRLIETSNKAILSFQFPQIDFSFYITFDYLLNTLQHELDAISDFSIVQGTLEQVVFLFFASFQESKKADTSTPKPISIFNACVGNDEDD